MALFQPPAGLMLDRPVLSGEPYWRAGYNVRFRLGQLETLGLFGPVRDIAGAQLAMPGPGIYRTLFAAPAVDVGQIIAAAANKVMLIDYDPGSTTGTGTRWRLTDITPATIADGSFPASDVVADPSVGRIETPPVWWFADQEDVVVGARSAVIGGPAYSWDRVPGNPFVPLTGSPTGSVGGGIIGRILVLLGCTSFADPDPARFMTIRWSDRFNFEDWTPSDINVSGELQLEGGSRIMGGGIVGFGVVAWTDKRMALLTETGDPDSVFARRYIDGGRGLMSNRSWCEADGNVWWYDETRTLNVWDGGRPTQVQNPLRLGTVERATDRDMARAYLVPNQEFNEVILWYPTSNNDYPDVGLVYNYAEQAWSVWALRRTAWSQRVGAIRNLGIDGDRKLFQHDLDASLIPPWLPAVMPYAQPLHPHLQATLDDITPYSWQIASCLVPASEPTSSAYHMTRYLLDHLPSPANGHATDTYTLMLRGYAENTMDSAVFEDGRTIVMGQNAEDFRVGGKALQVVASGTGATVWRFGMLSATSGGDGER